MYMPTRQDMAVALIPQLIVLGAIAWMLIASARRYCGLAYSLSGVVGGGVAHAVASLILVNKDSTSLAQLERNIIEFFAFGGVLIAALIGMFCGTLVAVFVWTLQRNHRIERKVCAPQAVPSANKWNRDLSL